MSIQSDDTYVYVSQPDQSGYNAGDMRTVIRKDDLSSVQEFVRNWTEEGGAEVGVQVITTKRIGYDFTDDTFEDVCAAFGIPTEPVAPPA